ncbi:tyrosine-type recombinase/integrase [bacterium]|nr:tyrosine-type recombinase/integrase [bacterium]
MSTKEVNKRRATDSAASIIRRLFAPIAAPKAQTLWPEAVEMARQQMVVDNLRPSTIDQYMTVLDTLRKIFPETAGPADITDAMASDFKLQRAHVSKRTLKGNIDNLDIVYNKWFLNACRIVDHNPFARLPRPKLDKPKPRVLTPEEYQRFLDWLGARWSGWDLPVLFIEVKAAAGCRITELAALKSADLIDGRMWLRADRTKNRRDRAVKLPAELFNRLLIIRGSEFAFETFPIRLREFLAERRRARCSRLVSEKYEPSLLKKWMEREAKRFLAENPDIPRFKLHNLRSTAMTKARMAGVPCDEAAIAFACNPETMRKHYLVVDELAITDRVMDVLHTGSDYFDERYRPQKGGETRGRWPKTS